MQDQESTTPGPPSRRQSALVVERRRVLAGVFDVLNRSGIRVCLLHGAGDIAARIQSDVDAIVDRTATPAALIEVLHRHRAELGAEVVRSQLGYIVLASRAADGAPCFLALDLTQDCDAGGLPLYDGDEVLACRRWENDAWIPAPAVEFGLLLTRAVGKCSLDDERSRRLCELFRIDEPGCAAQTARFWRGESPDVILAAARSQNWLPVRSRIAELRTELAKAACWRRPLRALRSRFDNTVGKLTRLLHPHGMTVVLLGPDGAGKSSIIDRAGPWLEPVFPRWKCAGFAPGLLAFLRGPSRSSSEPHALPPRSILVSVVRLAYWLLYHNVAEVLIRVDTARSTLILHDRHFVDILIDQRRYRYGGPVWILWLVWRLIPKPDLIILLDAPPEVLQARKQEVPFEVTAAQQQAYRALLGRLPNGRIVNAAQPLERVVSEVAAVILREQRRRLLSRFGLADDPAANSSANAGVSVAAE